MSSFEFLPFRRRERIYATAPGDREWKEEIHKRQPSSKRRFHSNNKTEQDGRLTLEKRNPNASFVSAGILCAET